MRCLSCNKNLNDYEATRKSATTGQYVDLCNRCFNDIKDEFLVIDRPDLINAEEVDIEEEFEVEVEDDNFSDR